MATVNVTTTNNIRVDDAESATGWTSIGGGAGGAAEGSFPYQGNNLYNRKITANRGFYYDPTLDAGSAVNMTNATSNTWMVKAIVTDFAGLRAANGLTIRIGSGTTAYYDFVIAGTNSPIAALAEYPPLGGVLIVPINPNVVAYRESTSGSPALTATDYFGIFADFLSSTAKSENVGLDAIDVGTGLILTGGDGADPDGTYTDFTDADSGTVNNRWGYATASDGGATLKGFGKWTIGSAGAATVFTDTTSSILWPDGLFAAGFSGVDVDLSNAGTVVVDGSTQSGLGSITTEDTRPDYIVTGTAGVATLSHTLNNFRTYTVNSKCSVTGASIQAATINQNNASIQDSSLRTTSLSGAATLVSPDFTNLSGIAFVQRGAGHAIEITTPGSYTFTDLTFGGYGADGTNSAAVYNNSGGLVTINVSGGGSPTVRNGTGATTNVVNSVSLTLSNIVEGSEVTIARNDNDLELFHVESVTASGTAIYSYDGALAGVGVRVLVHNVDQFENLNFNVNLPGSASEIPINQIEDRNYNNPI